MNNKDKFLDVSGLVIKQLLGIVYEMQAHRTELMKATTRDEQERAMVLLISELSQPRFVCEEGDKLLTEIHDDFLKNPS